MGLTQNLTLQTSVTKTAQFNGSFVGLAGLNKPISLSTGVNKTLTYIVNVTALTGNADFYLIGKDPLSGNTYTIPGSSMPTITATGEYAITVTGPFPLNIGLAVQPSVLAGGNQSVTYTGTAQVTD